MSDQPENPYAKLIPDQQIAIIPSFQLESGATLHNVPVAYKTYGRLSSNKDNAMITCHAVTGSSDVGDWWGPLLGGTGKAFDITRFYVVCINSLGSPYGTASPVTYKDGDPSQGLYGPEFPLTTVRDDVNLFKLLLDDLGVRQVATAIGGSMGGMLVLEFAYFGKDYVRSIVPMATSPRFSAWGISWGEAQRQSIYSDPLYEDGYYAFENPPSAGLGAARMSALLTYRSRDSFESRFGRNTPDPSKRQNINGKNPSSPNLDHFAIHNDGHRRAGSPRLPRSAANSVENLPALVDPQFSGTTPLPVTQPMTVAQKRVPTYYSAQSYLRYQADKFIKRFDANCYIAMTRKLDTHDLSRARTDDLDTVSDAHNEQSEGHDPVDRAMSLITQPTLVLGIKSDGLFTYAEQQLLAASIPNATLQTIDSPDGHDAFLLEFEQVNTHVLKFLKETLPDMFQGPALVDAKSGDDADAAGFEASRTSTFGEAEVDDITAW